MGSGKEYRPRHLLMVGIQLCTNNIKIDFIDFSILGVRRFSQILAFLWLYESECAFGTERGTWRELKIKSRSALL